MTGQAEKVQQEDELLKIGETLGNFKLDVAELRFLGSQEKLLLDAKTANMNLLLKDIQSANREQLKKDTKMNELLEGYVMKENIDDLTSSIAKKARLNDGGKKLKSRLLMMLDVWKSKEDKKLIVIKLLLDAYYKKIDAKYELKHPFTSGSDFAVLLHRFQKETNAGIASRSAVDCIVGRRTVQQLLAYQGLSVVQGSVGIDEDFTKSYEAKTKKIRTSAEAQKVIQLIMEDESLSEEEKFTTALEIYKKTPESGTDANGKKIEKSNPQYSAAVIIMTYAQKLLPALDENTRKNIKSMLTESGISKDWNTKNSNTYVKKSDNLFLEVDQKIERAKEKIQRIDMMLQFGDAWINYYQKKASNAREAGVSELYPQGVKEMEALKTYEGSDRNQKFSNAFDKMFFTTEARQDYHSRTTPSQYVYPGYGLLKSVWIDGYENHNHQVNFFYGLKGFVTNPAGSRTLGYDRNTEQGRRKMIDYFLSGMREIDEDYDSTILSRAEGYQSGDAVDKVIDSSVGTDQSLINLRVENDEDGFNKDMGKIDEFFTSLKTTPPSEENIKRLNELVAAVDFNDSNILSVPLGGSSKKTQKIYIPQKDGTVIESEIPVFDKKDLQHDPYAGYKQGKINQANDMMKSSLLSQTVKKYFGIGLTEEIVEKIKDSFSEAKQSAIKMKIDMISTAKKEYENQKKEIKEDIIYYTNLIAEYPNDPKVSEWMSLKKGLEAAVVTIDPDAVTENTEFGKDKNGNTVTIKAIMEDQKRSLYAKSFEVGLAWGVMESHKQSINALKGKSYKSADDKIISHFASVHGVGKYTADETINMYQTIAKELIVQIVICAVSIGIGTLVAKGVLNATKWALNASKVARLNALAARLGEYSQLAKGGLIPVFTRTVSTSTKVGALVTGTAGLVIEGTAFHVSSTILNNIYRGVDWNVGLDDARGYIQSIVFLGVLKEVSTVMGGVLKNGKCTVEQTKLLARLEAGESLTASEVALLPKMLPKGMQYSPNQIKALTNSKISLPQLASKTENNLMVAKNTRVVNNLESGFTDAEVISSRLLSKQAYKINFNMSKIGNLVKGMGVEMGSLMVTDQVISLLFDQKFKEISMKDMVSMLGMIIGLRALRKIDPLHKINEKLDEFMIKDAVRNGKGEIVDLVLYDGKTQTMWSEMKKKANETNAQQEKSKENTKKQKANENGPSKKASQEAPKKEEVKVEKEENSYDNLTEEEVKNKIQDINDQINKIEQGGGDINGDKFGNASIETIKNEITICEKNITNPKIQERLIALKNSLQLREAELAKLKREMTELMKAKNTPKAESANQKTEAKMEEKLNISDISFEKASTFDELYKQIDKTGSLTSTNGETYTAKELKILIEKVKSGEANLNVITREGGLRSKVAELIKNEENTLDIGLNSKKAVEIEDFELKRYANEPNIDRSYVEKSQDARKYFQERLINNKKITKDNFVPMMKEFHKKSAYKGSDIADIGEIRTGEVSGGRRMWAEEYTTDIVESLGLGTIESTFGITPYATTAEFDGIFTRCAENMQKIRDITVNSPGKNNDVLLETLADYYKDMLYARPFGNVNNSLFMNQVNFFLKANGLNAISNGHLDHIATRVGKQQFREIFKVNTREELPLATEELRREMSKSSYSKDIQNEIIAKNEEKRKNFTSMYSVK